MYLTICLICSIISIALLLITIYIGQIENAICNYCNSQLKLYIIMMFIVALLSGFKFQNMALFIPFYTALISIIIGTKILKNIKNAKKEPDEMPNEITNKEQKQ